MKLQNINATIGVEPGIGMKMNANVCVNPRNNGMNVEQVCTLFWCQEMKINLPSSLIYPEADIGVVKYSTRYHLTLSYFHLLIDLLQCPLEIANYPVQPIWPT